MSTTLRTSHIQIPNRSWLLVFLLLNLIVPSESDCPNNIYLTNKNCFNNIITFKKELSWWSICYK